MNVGSPRLRNSNLFVEKHRKSSVESRRNRPWDRFKEKTEIQVK